MRELLERAASTVASASEGSPVISTITVMLFYVMFNIVLAVIERLIFGERFEHILDPFFGACFIAFMAYCVVACAQYNTRMSEPYDAAWNPAESDADAFRLMVDCELNPTQLNHCVIVLGENGTFQEFYADHNNDKAAATRIAILRAAAREE